MAFTQPIGGTTFTEASFEGQAYANESTGFPRALQAVVEHGTGIASGTSTTSLTVGTGNTAAITVLHTYASGGTGAPGGFAVGTRVRIARTSAPTTTWMDGLITTAPNATTGAGMVVSVDATAGSGTFTDWTISLGTGASVPTSNPATIAQGGTGATDASTALSNLTGSNDGILGAHVDVIGVALWAVGNDSAPAWFDAVDGNRSTLMLAVLEFNSGTPLTTVTIYDLSPDTPSVLLTDTFSDEGKYISKHMVGGQFAVATDAGLRIYGWRKTTGFGVIQTAFAGEDCIACATGYGNDPVRDPGHGGFLPMHACTFANASTDGAGIVQEDGRAYTQAGDPGADYTAITIQLGRAFYPGSATTLVCTPLLNHITADDWTETTVGNDAADVVNHVALTPTADMDGDSQWLGWATATGWTLAFLPEPTALDQGVFSAHIDNAYNTWWMYGEPAGAFLMDADTVDRSNQANTLTETGTVTETAANGTSSIKLYHDWATGVFLRHSNNADFAFEAGGDTLFMKFLVSVESGYTTGTQILVDMRASGTGDGVTVRYDDTVSERLEVVLDYQTGGTVTLHSGTTILSDNSLHHVVVSVDAVTARLYVDGNQVHALSVTANAGLGNATAANTDLTIGGSSAATPASPATNLRIGQLFIGHDPLPMGFARWLYQMEAPTFAANAVSYVAATAQTKIALDINGGEIMVQQSAALQRFAGLVEETNDLTPGALSGTTNVDLAQVTMQNTRAVAVGNDGTGTDHVHGSRATFSIPQTFYQTYSSRLLSDKIRDTPRPDAEVRYQAQQVFPSKTVTQAGAVLTWNLRDAQSAKVTLTASAELQPTGGIDGGAYSLRVAQDGTGGWALTYESGKFLFPGGLAPSNTTTASAVDRFTFIQEDGKLEFLGQGLDYS